MTVRERIETALRGGRPGRPAAPPWARASSDVPVLDRPAWATRLDIWHASCMRTGRLPEEFRGMPLTSIHRALGVGRQAYVQLAKTRLAGAELTVTVNGRREAVERDPVLRFPAAVDKVPMREPGEVELAFGCPAGTARARYRITQDILDAASSPYISRHILAEDSDWPAVEWLLEHSQVVPCFDDFLAMEKEIGDFGLTVGMITRAPFQRVVLDFMGEERAFYQMYDEPARFAKLLERLTENDQEFMKVCCASPALLVEYSDNVDGEITNPDLFRRYNLPIYRRASERLHAAGKLLGSHLDGDLTGLLELIADSGIDLAESFSPEPLSRVTFEQARRAWPRRPLMWGVLPSPIFEAETSAADFEAYLDRVLPAAEGGGMILGVADQAVSLTLLERVRRVGERLRV